MTDPTYRCWSSGLDDRINLLIDELGCGITLAEDGADLGEDANGVIREFVLGELERRPAAKEPEQAPVAQQGGPARISEESRIILALTASLDLEKAAHHASVQQCMRLEREVTELTAANEKADEARAL